ncbi:hypothetical protein OG713_19945 [Streptomyces sp. NBC_00723]|uniref:hypothetical protein n=1 Tax=Streptomyces sp. NBC_00723 TaxID=2903673 RepID=UPI00386D02BA
MQPQRTRAVTITWERPRIADLLIAGTLYYLLHQQPQVHETIAAAVALASLRCLRIDRVRNHPVSRRPATT